MNFIAATLAYTPSARLSPLEGCAHPFFDDLRKETTVLPNGGRALPPVLNFTARELSQSPELLEKLIPPHSNAKAPSTTSELSTSSSKDGRKPKSNS